MPMSASVSLSARRRFVRLALLPLLALVFNAFVSTDATAQPRAFCDKGYEPTSTTSINGVIIECWGKFTTTVKNYISYQPCVSPGVYLSNDETPSGSSAGRDRCTVAGVSGPSLSCAAGLTLEIVKGAKDKCYSTTTSTKSEKGEIRCYRIDEYNVKKACFTF